MRLRDAARGFGRTARCAAPDPADLRDDALRRVDEAHETAAAGWWVLVQVVSGREFAVVERLAERGVFAFAPVVEVWAHRSVAARLRGERKRRAVVAAAPGWVLARMDDLGRGLRRWPSLYACPDVLRVSEAAGVPLRLRPAHVRLAAAMFAPVADMPAAWRPAVGDAVVVAAGPLAGQRAVIEAVRGDEADLAMAGLMALAGRVRASLSSLRAA